MESWTINGHTLEYDDDSHIYIVDGVIVPSITQILATKFGGKYDGVNRATLQRAAERGTAVHEAIEAYCKTGADDGSKEVRNFKFLQSHYGFEVCSNELPVLIFNNHTLVAAGRLDMVMMTSAEIAIADIKTTATLDKEYLAYQLNLYRIGYMQSYYGIYINALYGVHLREDKRKLVKIPINEGMAWDIIERSGLSE